ncbi:Nuclear transport factor 2 [Paramecium bursaria]
MENQVAQQFLQSYYQALMTNKLTLIQFYTDVSSMTYGGEQHRGLKQISDKLESLGFTKIVYKIDDMDVQLGAIQNSLFIFVTGSLQMDDPGFLDTSKWIGRFICPQ